MSTVPTSPNHRGQGLKAVQGTPRAGQENQHVQELRAELGLPAPALLKDRTGQGLLESSTAPGLEAGAQLQQAEDTSGVLISEPSSWTEGGKGKMNISSVPLAETAGKPQPPGLEMPLDSRLECPFMRRPRAPKP